ncbi:MAG: hypothetical protein WCT49_01580 [Candidatus Paceibacterota bacterium]|jgi:hypothetical protein|nr:hypothetical protein [Candidatus Paceibacterota bacterium]
MNKTTKVVTDGTKMSNEQLGLLTRRHDEIKRRINEGAIHFDEVAKGYQAITEGGRIIQPIVMPMFTVTATGKALKYSLGQLRKKWCVVSAGTERYDSLDPPLQKGKILLLGIIHCDEFHPDELETSIIRKEAHRRGWISPPAEVACLLREKFSTEDINSFGLTRLAIMHEPYPDKTPYLDPTDRKSWVWTLCGHDTPIGALHGIRCMSWNYFSEDRYGFVFQIPNFIG